MRLGVAGWAILGAPIAAHASWQGLEKLEENCISMDLYGFLWISIGLVDFYGTSMGFLRINVPCKGFDEGQNGRT